MDHSKCKLCGAEMPRTWVNKRGQRVGKCKACGKLVSYGKDRSEQTGAEGDGTEARAGQTAQEETAEKHSPSPARRDRERRGTTREQRGFVQPGGNVQRTGGGGDGRISGFLSRKLW